ncbi:MAG: hypothetical protein U0491_02625 [Candidatus Saccharimonadales bacterium]
MIYGYHETYRTIDQDSDNLRYRRFFEDLQRSQYDGIPTFISWNQIGYEHNSEIETDNRVEILWHESGVPLALKLQTRDDRNFTDNVLVHFGLDSLTGRSESPTTTIEFAEYVQKVIEAEGLYGARPGMSEHVFAADTAVDRPPEDCHLYIVWVRSMPVSLSLEVRTNPESPMVRHAFFGRGARG